MSNPTITSAPFLQWPATKQLITLLDEANIDARFVGGCVRDALLNREVKDVDLASPVEPEEALHRLQDLGVKVIPTGIEHGTITIVIDHTPFELTTLRRDMDCDGRHAIVAYTDDWEQDAKRRDFTINAIYADTDGKVYDYYDGLNDLKTKQLKFIGDPQARIKEDALRILRLFRFQAQLGFSVDQSLYLQCKKSARLLKKISEERICQETLRLLAAENPTNAWQAMFDYDVANIYQHQLSNRMDLVLLVEKQLVGHALDADARLALLAWLTESSDAGELKTLLKLSNMQSGLMSNVLDRTALLVPNMSLSEQRTLHYQLGSGVYRLCIIAAAVKELAGHVERSLDTYQHMLGDANQWQPPAFEVSGADLMTLGFSEGKALGEQLKQLEQRWINSDFSLSKEQLLSTVRAA